MNQIFLGAIFAGILFLGIFIMMEVGRYIRSRKQTKDIESARPGVAVLEVALFGLLGLILAFSFSGAMSRFDARRQLIIEEANCIGTAYLRLDVLPIQVQTELQGKFLQYLDTRLAAYAALPNIIKTEAGIKKAVAIQREIWTKALTACQQASSPQSAIIVLPALNSMFDIANTRYLATKIHPPQIIFWLMGFLVLSCSLLAGFAMGGSTVRSWIHIFIFAAFLTIIIYTIFDIEFPRAGLFQVKDFDQALVEVRNNM
jgi:hypothetical protein